MSVQKLWVGEDGIDTIRRVIPDPPALSAAAGNAFGAGTTTASALAGLLGGAGGTGGTTDLTTAALQAAQAAYARSAI